MSEARRLSLLESLFETIGQYPINLLIGMLIIGGAFLSILSFLIAILIFFITQSMRRVILVSVGFLGLLFALGSWCMDSISLFVVHRSSIQLMQLLLGGQWHGLRSFYPWLSALPYGLILGVLLSFLKQHQRKMRKALQRVSQGKSLSAKRMVRPARLERLLKAIPQAAQKNGTE